MSTKIILVVLVLLTVTPVARSQGTLAWYFDTTEFVVQPTDQILLTCTVSNLSGQAYTIFGWGSSFGGPLQYHYAFSPLIDLDSKIVPGYGSLQFDYGTLTPIGGYVTPGTYYADPARINFSPIPSTGQLSENTFQITVVPEPTSLALTTIGILYCHTRRHSKWKRSSSLYRGTHEGRSL